MSNPRVTPHRAKREESKTKELTDLKRENHQLKRAVKRLEREFTKRTQIEEDLAEQGLQEQGEEVQAKAKKDGSCQKCGCDALSVFSLQNRIYAVCKECGWRGRAGAE